MYGKIILCVSLKGFLFHYFNNIFTSVVSSSVCYNGNSALFLLFLFCLFVSFSLSLKKKKFCVCVHVCLCVCVCVCVFVYEHEAYSQLHFLTNHIKISHTWQTSLTSLAMGKEMEGGKEREPGHRAEQLVYVNMYCVFDASQPLTL